MQWSEADWIRLQQTRAQSARGRALTLATALLGGAALVLSRWTAAVGGLILAFAAMIWFTPRMTRHGARSEYRRTDHLHAPITYGVGDDGMWIHASSMRAHSAWPGLKVWDERDGWLILQADGMLTAYYPVAALRAEGVYEEVLALARSHGVLFDSPEAKASFSTRSTADPRQA